jgi:hypothetical protein
MIKLLVKLAVAAAVANAVVRIGSAYIVHVQFRDSVRQEISRGGSDEELQQRVLDVAAAYDIPLEPEAFQVGREQRQAYAEGHYVKPIMVLPGVPVRWTFSWEIDTYLPDGGPAVNPR